MSRKFIALRLFAAVISFAIAQSASAAAPWADTPVTCHWIGAVKAGTNGNGDYAEWRNPDNWEEGIVPGRVVADGVTNGCDGCVAVFDRACTYVNVDFSGLVSVSNIVFSGSSVPRIYLGRDSNAHIVLERLGGIYVDEDVVSAPYIRAPLQYYRGEPRTVTTLYLENNSASELEFKGRYEGPDIPFGNWVGACTLVVRGKGDVKRTGATVASGFYVTVNLDMSGGKYIQAVSDTLQSFRTGSRDFLQHLEISSGVTVQINDAGSIDASTDMLVDGAGKIKFVASTNPARVSVISGKTLTLDCLMERTAGKTMRVGWWDNSGTVRLAPGRSFGTSVEYYQSPSLQFLGSGTFAYALTIESSSKGTLIGPESGETKLTGGMSGTTRTFTLKGSVAIASDVTASTVFAADSKIAFRKADDADIAFTISSVKLMGNKTVPVESGVTATITAINNNGYTLDIRPEGTGKVKFSGLSAGFSPIWLTINGRRGVISASGELVTQSSIADDTAIDAHGGVVPNSSASVVAVTTANGPAADNVMLAADSTSVMMLRQRQAVDDVQIDMSAGQTLSAGVVSVVSGAKSLTVGSSAGVGALAPNGDAIELDAADAASKITVNAAVSMPSNTRIMKEGSGDVVFNGPATGLMEMQGGSLSFTNGENGVTLSGSNATFVVAGSVASGSRFDIAMTDGAVEMSGHLENSRIVVASNGVGRIDMTGGCVTGALICTANSSSKSAFRMKGGEFVNPSHANISGSGFAYMKIEGGVCRMTAADLLELGYENSMTFEQTGGEFRRSGVISVGRAKHKTIGSICIKGGKFVCDNDIRMPTYNAGGGGIITVEGSDTAFNIEGNYGLYLSLVDNNQNSGKGYGNRSMVNLNGGTLKSYTICRHGWYSNVAERAYLNFNGGTYDYRGWGAPFGGLDVYQYRLDRVTSFERGATVNVGSGYSASSPIPIEAPVGKGVESVAWTSISGLPGSPLVVITDPDGTGEGASAFAEVDDYGTITNIHVTSPGWNYTRATANLYLGRAVPENLIATFDCVLKDQKSGGFTKTGNGTFATSCTNTYTGATVVKGGTLQLGCDDAIDSRSALVLAGGKLDLNGHSQKFSSVSGTSGSVINGTLGLTGLTVDMQDAVAGIYPTLTAPVSFAAGAEVSILNAEAETGRHSYTFADFTGGVNGDIALSSEAIAALPSGNGIWQLKFMGSKLKLLRIKGAAFILR